MKKQYEIPEWTVVFLEQTDIVTASGEDTLNEDWKSWPSEWIEN